MNTKHTPEPWDAEFIEHHEGCGCCTRCFDDADKCRIVACVNACAGMDDPEVEIAALRGQREELLAALISVTDSIGLIESVTGQPITLDRSVQSALRDARAAIAKVSPKVSPKVQP